MTVSASRNSDERRYIGSMTVNGLEYDKNYLDHDMLTAGATIVYEMVGEPAVNRGVSAESRPYSFSNEIDPASKKM